MVNCDNTKCVECGFLRDNHCLLGKKIKDTRVLPDIDNLTFGEKLRAIRKAKAITQQRLADRAGISQIQISLYERDKNLPSMFVFELLCKALNVKSSVFLDF